MRVLIPYKAMFCYRMCMKNAGNDAIFFYFLTFFLQNEMYCIFCPDSGNVSVFFSSGRDFFLVVKYVHVYIMFSLKKIAKSGLFFPYPCHFFNTNSIYFFNSLDENESVFFIWWGILSSFQIWMVYIGFYGR